MGKGIVAAAAVVALAGIFAAPAGASPRSCAGAGRTVAANEQARVFRVTQLGAPVYFACRHGDPRGRLRLAAMSMDMARPRVLLAGRRILVAERIVNRHNGDEDLAVRVVDLATRRTERRWTFARSGGAPGPGLDVHGPVLRPDGSVAFLAGPLTPSESSVGTTYELHRADATGRTVVAAGPDLDPRSPAVGEGRLYWSRAGAPGTAPFRAREVGPVRDRSPRSRCSRPRSRTLGSTEKVRLLTIPSRDEPGERVLVACRLETGRGARLGESTMFWSLPSVAALAGDRVLLETRHADRYSSDVMLHVDLFRVPGGLGPFWRLLQRSGPGPSPPPPTVHGRALGPAGQAAFLAGPLSPPGGGERPDHYAVHASTRAGRTVVLDSATDIDPRSFAAGERRIYWVRGGVIRTAAWP